MTIDITLTLVRAVPLPMRSSTMIATLQWLGVVPSFSRPHVSDDNPYSEALFRTLKHTPAYPRLPFVDIGAAERWVARFVDWYNREHRHSAIRYVTPAERHFGREPKLLADRQELVCARAESQPRTLKSSDAQLVSRRRRGSAPRTP